MAMPVFLFEFFGTPRPAFSNLSPWKGGFAEDLLRSRVRACVRACVLAS